MSSYVWVCFGCRTASRRSPRLPNVRCRLCREPCECLGYKTRIPVRTKVKEWSDLCRSFYESRRALFLRKDRAKVRRTHDLEREISRLEEMTQNEGRSDAIKLMRKELEGMRPNTSLERTRGR
jgi:hypothetical protein